MTSATAQTTQPAQSSVKELRRTLISVMDQKNQDKEVLPTLCLYLFSALKREKRFMEAIAVGLIACKAVSEQWAQENGLVNIDLPMSICFDQQSKFWSGMTDLDMVCVDDHGFENPSHPIKQALRYANQSRHRSTGLVSSDGVESIKNELQYVSLGPQLNIIKKVIAHNPRIALECFVRDR